MTKKVIIEDLQKLNVEQIIYFTKSSQITIEKLREEVNKIEESEVKEDLLQKIDFASKRVNSSLDISSKIFYIVAPFGIINAFLDSHNQEFEKYEKYGYLKKIRQYYIFSTLGIMLYVIIPLILGIIFK